MNEFKRTTTSGKSQHEHWSRCSHFCSNCLRKHLFYLPSCRPSCLLSLFCLFPCLGILICCPVGPNLELVSQDDFSQRCCPVSFHWTTLGLCGITHFLFPRACESYDCPDEQYHPCLPRLEGQMGSIRGEREGRRGEEEKLMLQILLEAPVNHNTGFKVWLSVDVHCISQGHSAVFSAIFLQMHISFASFLQLIHFVWTLAPNSFSSPLVDSPLHLSGLHLHASLAYNHLWL